MCPRRIWRIRDRAHGTLTVLATAHCLGLVRALWSSGTAFFCVCRGVPRGSNVAMAGRSNSLRSVNCRTDEPPHGRPNGRVDQKFRVCVHDVTLPKAACSRASGCAKWGAPTRCSGRGIKAAGPARDHRTAFGRGGRQRRLLSQDAPGFTLAGAVASNKGRGNDRVSRPFVRKVRSACASLGPTANKQRNAENQA